MKHHLRAFGLGVLLALGCVVGYSQLDKILKAGGIALVVDRFGGDMDRALNRLTNTKPDKNFATKVVPILSAGNGAHIGAAQVMGKPTSCARCKPSRRLKATFWGVRCACVRWSPFPRKARSAASTAWRALGCRASSTSSCNAGRAVRDCRQ
jgi:hypothetical protein